MTRMTIDTGFDFRLDTPLGKDPDTHSPTLRRYHRLLWSKQLPNGDSFDLSATPRCYLHHDSKLGKFCLTSDAVMQTFTRWIAAQHIIKEFPASENEEFVTIAYTIGAMMVFPGNKVDGKMTINQARGWNQFTIGDRLDLTLECIRRYYLDQRSPLATVLKRYPRFFDLFGDFRGYVNYFLLEDLVNDDDTVKFFIEDMEEFNDFQSSAVPRDINTYREFRRNSIEFIEARNQRIEQLNCEGVTRN